MHYIPVLRNKAAELRSLTLLHQPQPTNLKNLWPLVEVREVASEDAIKATMDDILKALNASPCRRFLVDLEEIEANHPDCKIAKPPSQYSSLEYLSLEAAGSWKLTPVITLSSGNNFIGEAQKAARIHGAGVAIRINFDDINEPNFTTDLDTLITTLGTPLAETHILIDVGIVTDDKISHNYMAIIGALSILPQRAAWASITLIGAAYPKEAPSVAAGPGGIARIPRSDWKLFVRVLAAASDVHYGDYGIENPAAIPSTLPYFSSNLRYTTDDDWIFVKGKSNRQGGHDFFRDVCRVMVSQPEYKGNHYSWGDDFISNCGANQGGTGSPTTWRQIAITHHITFVLEQVNRLGTGGAATTPAF